MMNSAIPSLVQCTKCSSKFDFVKGRSADAPKLDSKDNVITDRYKELFAEFRFLCPTCRT